MKVLMLLVALACAACAQQQKEERASMASVNMIPWEQALAAEKAAFDQNRQLMMMGVAPEGGFRNDYAYMGDTFDPAKWLQQKGFWQQGFRPGMALPQINASNFEDFVEMATPLAVMGGAALGGSALAGSLGATAAPNALAAGAGLGGASSAGAGGALAGGGAAAGAGLAEEMAALGIANGGIGAGAAGAGAGGGGYLASLDAADAVLGQDMLNMAASQGVDLSPLWSTNVFGAGAASNMGTVGAGGAPAAPSATAAPVASPAAVGGAASATGLPGASSLLGNPQVLGMAGGALLGGMGGGGGPAGTTTSEQGIPDWLMPYVKPALDKYSTDIQNYNVDPYGVMPAAMQEFKNTVGGMYLDPSTNKWLDEYYKLGAERIKGTISPSFGHMQAFGSHSGYNEALSRGLGDFSVGLFGGNYQKERDRQQQMTAAAPSFLQSSSQAAFAPYQGYLNTVGGLGKKTQQPYFEGSDMQNALGGALAGWGLGNLFKT
jgi:hypothetical protein